MKTIVSKEELYDTFERRLESRFIITEDYYFDTRLLSWIFSFESSLESQFEDLKESLFNDTLFKTRKEEITTQRIKAVEIDGFVEVIDDNNHKHLVLERNQPYDPVQANDLSQLRLHITEDVKKSIQQNWNDLKAIPDLLTIIREICPEIRCNTSYCNHEKIRRELNNFEESRELLIKMRYDLMEDFELITKNIKIYWD